MAAYLGAGPRHRPAPTSGRGPAMTISTAESIGSRFIGSRSRHYEGGGVRKLNMFNKRCTGFLSERVFLNVLPFFSKCLLPIRCRPRLDVGRQQRHQRRGDGGGPNSGIRSAARLQRADETAPVEGHRGTQLGQERHLWRLRPIS